MEALLTEDQCVMFELDYRRAVLKDKKYRDSIGDEE